MKKEQLTDTSHCEKQRLVAGLITGKAKELFLKWFKEEKLMSGFEDHSELIQIFALNEFFGTVGYKISIISRFIQDDYGYIVYVNEGEHYRYGLNSRLEAERMAIETANREFNDKLSEACH